MNPDEQEWLRQCRMRIDAAKVAVESNGRLPAHERADLASKLESVFKQARTVLQAMEAGRG